MALSALYGWAGGVSIDFLPCCEGWEGNSMTFYLVGKDGRERERGGKRVRACVPVSLLASKDPGKDQGMPAQPLRVEEEEATHGAVCSNNRDRGSGVPLKREWDDYTTVEFPRLHFLDLGA